MNVDFLRQADKAMGNAARSLTALLREHLVQRGWPEKAASSVEVIEDAGSLSVDYVGDYADEARVLEYGDQRVRPSGTIRKFLANQHVVHKAYLGAVEDQIGDIL